MKLNDYLRNIMSVRDARKLRGALRLGKPVIISGAERTGKTTLCRVLRAKGYKVYESFDTLHLELKRVIPIEDCIPNLYQKIE